MDGGCCMPSNLEEKGLLLEDESSVKRGIIVGNTSLSSGARSVNVNRALEKRNWLCRVAEYHLQSRLATRLNVRLKSIQRGQLLNGRWVLHAW